MTAEAWPLTYAALIDPTRTTLPALLRALHLAEAGAGEPLRVPMRQMARQVQRALSDALAIDLPVSLSRAGVRERAASEIDLRWPDGRQACIRLVICVSHLAPDAPQAPPRASWEVWLALRRPPAAGFGPRVRVAGGTAGLPRRP